MTEFSKTCWVLTEGMAGTENQCLGVAEALGVVPVVKRITLRFPWKQLSPWLRWGHQWALGVKSDRLQPPYPDLIIASGRKSIGVALALKEKCGAFLVQVQDPRIDPALFDLVAVPAHDPARGDNVLVLTAGLHRVTTEILNSARQKWEKAFDTLPRPRIAVMIGGNSKAHQLTRETTQKLIGQLRALKGGLMVTASRRTGEENARLLKEGLAAPHIYFWDGQGENPYFGFLALADYILVTEDSVSMTSEALATGKPVYTIALEGGAKRLDLFHETLQKQGYTRVFDGKLETWSYAPPNDTQKVADEIKRRMKRD